MLSAQLLPQDVRLRESKTTRLILAELPLLLELVLCALEVVLGVLVLALIPQVRRRPFTCSREEKCLTLRSCCVLTLGCRAGRVHPLHCRARTVLHESSVRHKTMVEDGPRLLWEAARQARGKAVGRVSWSRAERERAYMRQRTRLQSVTPVRCCASCELWEKCGGITLLCRKGGGTETCRSTT